MSSPPDNSPSSSDNEADPIEENLPDRPLYCPWDTEECYEETNKTEDEGLSGLKYTLRHLWERRNFEVVAYKEDEKIRTESQERVRITIENRKYLKIENQRMTENKGEIDGETDEEEAVRRIRDEENESQVRKSMILAQCLVLYKAYQKNKDSEGSSDPKENKAGTDFSKKPETPNSINRNDNKKSEVTVTQMVNEIGNYVKKYQSLEEIKENTEKLRQVRIILEEYERSQGSEGKPDPKKHPDHDCSIHLDLLLIWLKMLPYQETTVKTVENSVRLREKLKNANISITWFGLRCFNKIGPIFRPILKKPKKWNELSDEEKEIYILIDRFLKLDEKVQEKIFDVVREHGQLLLFQPELTEEQTEVLWKSLDLKPWLFEQVIWELSVKLGFPTFRILAWFDYCRYESSLEGIQL